MAASAKCGRTIKTKPIKKKFKKLKAYDKKIEKNGLKIMAFFRLIPLFPFNGLNYAMGLTKIKIKDYILGTLCILPGTFVYTYLGATATDLRSPQFYLALTFLAVLILVPTIYKKWKGKHVVK